MGALVYARADENVAPDAIVTIDNGTESTSFPIAGAAGVAPIADLNPAKEKSFTTTTGGIVFNFGSAQILDGIAIIHHVLDASLANVQIQGNATDVWTSPTLDVNVPIPAGHADGFPVNPWVDLTGEGSRTFQYWRLNFGTANSVPIKLGQVLLLSNLRFVTKNFEIGALEEEEHRIIPLETDFGIEAIFDFGVKRRQLIGRIVTDNTESDTWFETKRQTRGRARAWFIARDRDVNDAMFVRFVNPSGYGRVLRSHGVHVLPFQVKEVSRGLVL